jgi:NAD(P)-dependent dehydrogenase (short-subunit alcohol dehydrogenase family)
MPLNHAVVAGGAKLSFRDGAGSPMISRKSYEAFTGGRLGFSRGKDLHCHRRRRQSWARQRARAIGRRRQRHAVDLDADKLARTVREFDTDHAAFVAADVTDAAQTRNYVEQTVKRFGKIDVLFSNAGNDGPLMPITEYPEDLFDRIIATHVRGCFLACKYTIPQMNDGGSIIITASTVGVQGVPFNCSYGAAKHALMGMMRGVAKEVASRGIRVNSVNPGPVDNPFMRTAEKTMSVMLGRDAGKWFDEQIPLGRHAVPEEIAQAVCFLASDRSSFTTGAALMVDGGYCA